MARLRGYLDLAAELQRPGERLTVSTTSGGDPDDWEPVKETLVDRFGELAEYAQRAGVMVGMEPHVGAALHRPEQALWLLEQVDSPGLTIHFDISHFNVQGMAMEPVIAQLAPHSAAHPRQGRARPRARPRVPDSRRRGDGLRALPDGDGSGPATTATSWSRSV